MQNIRIGLFAAALLFVVDVRGTVRAEGGPVDLEELKDSDKGFSILVPKGAESQSPLDLSSTFQRNYFFALPGGMNGYLVTIEPDFADSLEAAEQKALEFEPKVIASKKEVDGVFLITKGPAGVNQEVWAFRKVGEKSIKAKCSGPSDDLATLEKMCSSLKVSE